MSRRLPLLLLLALAALPAWALEPVVLQLNWKHQFQFAGYYAALEKGYYREAGFDVTLREAAAGEDPIADVLEGRARFGVGASELALRRGLGQPVVVLAAILQHSPLVLIARDDKGDLSLHDLKGKRIMLMPHETELYAYLQREQLPISAVQALQHSFDPRDLIQGRVDAVSAYATDEPFVLDRARLRYALFTPRSAGIDFYGDTLFTSERQAREAPEATRAFREASLKGWRYATSHPAEIADLILAKYGTRHSREHLLFEAAEMHKLMAPELIEIGYMLPGRWQHIADTYVELGMLPRDYSLDGFLFDPAPRPLPPWVLPALLGGGLALLLAGLAALRFAQLTHRLKFEVEERKAAGQRLRATQRDMMGLIDATPGAAMLLDAAGRILTINQAGAARFRSSKAEMLGRDVFALSPPEITAHRRHAVAQAMAERRPVVLDDERAGRDLRNTIVPVEDEDGEVRRVAVFSDDITDRKRAETEAREAYRQLQAQYEEIWQLQAALQERAVRDSLTRLYNRSFLDENLERELARARREGYPLALVMIDLDRFKEINDSHGHKVGDEALRMVAGLLRAEVRAEDLPCRYGGEEFLVLLPKMPLAMAAARAERWRQTLAAQALPLDGETVRLTASFGVAAFPEHGDSADALTRQADDALYAAKNAGRNRVAIAQGAR